MTAVRDIERSIPFAVVRADENSPDDGLTLEGHAAVFDTPTRIDSWEGTFDEQIRKGAFRKTLRERTPVLQFDHGRHPLVGSIPLGVIKDSREDDDGLFVSARMTDNWLVQPIRDAIAEGAVDGMSFRFEVVREEWRDKDGKLLKDDSEIMQLLYRPDDRGPLQRTLIELKVPELGPVVFPAYRETDVGVRARSIAETITEDDEFVRQVRSSLAAARDDATNRPDDPDLSDPELRRQVARALLFDAPPAGHPSTEQSATRSDDAPLESEHPSDDDDAPPPDGHPSATTPSATQDLREDIREWAEFARTHVASIKEKES